MTGVDEAKRQYLVNVMLPKHDKILVETVLKRKHYPEQVQQNFEKRLHDECSRLETVPDCDTRLPSPTVNTVLLHSIGNLTDKRALLQSMENTRHKLAKLEESAKMEGQNVRVECQPHILQSFREISTETITLSQNTQDNV